MSRNEKEQKKMPFVKWAIYNNEINMRKKEPKYTKYETLYGWMACLYTAQSPYLNIVSKIICPSVTVNA